MPLPDFRVTLTDGAGAALTALGDDTTTVRSLANNVAIAAGATTTPVANIPGGTYILTVQGAFGVGTISIESLGPDGVNYVAANPAVALTATGSVGVVIPNSATVRLRNTGGTGATAIFASLG